MAGLDTKMSMALGKLFLIYYYKLIIITSFAIDDVTFPLLPLSPSPLFPTFILTFMPIIVLISYLVSHQVIYQRYCPSFKPPYHFLHQVIYRHYYPSFKPPYHFLHQVIYRHYYPSCTPSFRRVTDLKYQIL
jgi:hypothetical protein